jgi:hypothetical protein
LLIAACAAALAVPYVLRPVPPGPPPDAVMVLDVSASMQTRDGSSTRFAAAQAAAEARAGELHARGRRITVIAAGVHPQIVGTGLDGSLAVRAIGSLRALDTSGNLTAATEIAATQAGREGSIDLFTDMPAGELVMSRDARAATTVHTFGKGGDNAAVIGLGVYANPFEDVSSSRVLVTLRNFSTSPREIEVTLAPLATGRAPTGSVSLRRTVKLEPRSTEVVTIEGLPWSGPFSAAISPPDDLPLDDTVYGFIATRHPLHIFLTSDDVALRREFEELARRLGNVVVRSTTSAEYRPQTTDEITIFDRFVPRLPPSGNVAYLAPQQGNADVTIVGDMTQARFAELRQHDVLSGVQNPDTLLRGRLARLAPAGSLKPRIVATAFSLRPGDLRSADALPSLVFTINLLRWLSPTARDAPLQRLAGERLRTGFADATPIARLTGPDGTRELAPAEELTLERAGVYRAIGSGTTTDLLVSFVDPEESDIARPEALVAQPSAVAPAVVESAPVGDTWKPFPYTREALLVVLAAMLLEWLVLAATARPRSRRVRFVEGEAPSPGGGV